MTPAKNYDTKTQHKTTRAELIASFEKTNFQEEMVLLTSSLYYCFLLAFATSSTEEKSQQRVHICSLCMVKVLCNNGERV